jgi:hypothetical protein
MSNPIWPVLWVATGLGIVVAAVQVLRGSAGRALLLGRVSLGLLFIVGGALVHVVNLLTDVSYRGFADPAHFWWVSETWRSVVAPHQVLFISLLIAFEFLVGALVLRGGRWTRLGLVAAIGFHLALWLFGWMETVWCLAMIPALAILLRGESRAASSRERSGHRVATAPALST